MNVVAGSVRASVRRNGCARWCGLLLLLLSGLPDVNSASAQDAKPHALVLVSGKGPYAEAAQALIKALEAAGHKAELLELSDADLQNLPATRSKLLAAKPTLVAAAGPNLTTLALETVPNVPVVFFMVPNALDAPFMAPDFPQKKRVAGVTSDVAPADQIDFVRKLQPDCKKLGVLTSDHSRATAAALVAAGKERGLESAAVAADANKFAAGLEELRRGGFQGALMLPDAQVYNAANVQGLLLWGLRDKCTVLGFSDKVVKAGALAGIYSDPADVGRETATVIDQILKGKSATELGLRYPRAPRRGVNVHTAELIGTNLDALERLPDVERFGESK